MATIASAVAGESIVHEVEPDRLLSLLEREANAAPSPRTSRERQILRTLRAAPEKAVFVVSGQDHEAIEALRSIVSRLPRLIATKRGEKLEQSLQKLVEVMASADPMERVMLDIEQDNIELREQFLKDWPCLESADVHRLAGATAGNVAQTASRWKAKGLIFSVPCGGRQLYPAFQFRDGRPIKTIAAVLGIFGETLSPWQIAFWFTDANGWLDGRKPVELLEDSPENVIEAARREAEEPQF